MAVERVTIKIPRPLYDKIQALIENSGFSSVTDFVVYVLRDVIGEREAEKAHGQLTDDEVNVIRRRLKSLGYL